MKVFTQFFSAFILLCSFSTMAFTPTASQIEQFKKLPKAQQEALAKQYGVDISTITGANQSNDADSNEQQSTIGERPEKEQEDLTDEDGDVFGRLNRNMYGFRDAANAWFEDWFTITKQALRIRHYFVMQNEAHAEPLMATTFTFSDANEIWTT